MNSHIKSSNYVHQAIFKYKIDILIIRTIYGAMNCEIVLEKDIDEISFP